MKMSTDWPVNRPMRVSSSDLAWSLEFRVDGRLSFPNQNLVGCDIPLVLVRSSV